MLKPFSVRHLCIAAVAASLLATGACSRIQERHGYVADQELIEAIQPGVDNKESIVGMLGRPTFQSEFDENTWYYVSRRTEQFAFFTPKPAEQQVVQLKFGANGYVEAVNKAGMEQIVSVNTSNDETPTLGRDRSWFDALFGNVGQVGSLPGGAAGPPQ